jgi:hypothetical protein
MQFTKTLLATALFAVAGVAQASFTATDEYLTVIDTTNNSAYVLDLGVTPAALAASPSLSVSLDSSDANFSSFESGITAGDTVLYRVEGAYNTTVSTKSYGHVVGSFTTSLASDFAGQYPNSSTGVSHLASTVSTLNTEAGYYSSATASEYLAAGSAYSIWGTNAQTLEGTTVINSAAVGSALTLWGVDRTGTSAITETNLAAVNLAVTGTGANAVGALTVGSVSSIPLPTSVWLFLSGVMGVLSLKRRKNAAV